MLNPVAPRLAEIIEDPADFMLANSILGTADPTEIHRALAAFCRMHLAAELADVIFCQLSVGAAFGLVLTDDRRVFLKAWPARTSVLTLDAVNTVHSALATGGFPAPRCRVDR